jgi:hypothetical protein
LKQFAAAGAILKRGKMSHTRKKFGTLRSTRGSARVLTRPNLGLTKLNFLNYRINVLCGIINTESGVGILKNKVKSWYYEIPGFEEREI